MERLGFYKLRAKIVFEDVSASVDVMEIWYGAMTAQFGVCYPDPRLPELGLRCASPHPTHVALASGAGLLDAEAYEAHRIKLGVPSGGVDFLYGDAFPHEADMDQLHGVDFRKGCFVGQEVVSRMEHRGTGRTRVVPVAFDGAAPAIGSAVTADGKQVGRMGSAAAGRGLASLRLDRLEDALASGAALVAGETALRLLKPAWARFAFPGDPAAPHPRSSTTSQDRPMSAASTPTACAGCPWPQHDLAYRRLSLTPNGARRNSTTARCYEKLLRWTASRPASPWITILRKPRKLPPRLSNT